MSLKTYYYNRKITKKQFDLVLKKFLNRYKSKLLLLSKDFNKNLSSVYNSDIPETVITLIRLYFVTKIASNMEIIKTYKNKKKPSIELIVNKKAILLTIRLIRTYILCTNFKAFYRHYNELLGELIYGMLCYVYIYFRLPYSDNPIKKKKISNSLFNNMLNYKNFTSMCMKILLKYDRF
jgi:hypothetical protein